MRVGLGGYLGGYTGTPPDQSQGPIFNIFKAIRPTHGQMKAILCISMRFLRLGLELTSDDPQNGSRIDLR